MTPQNQRPILKEQIEARKLTVEECTRLLAGRNLSERLDFWLFKKCKFLWEIIHWNWF